MLQSRRYFCASPAENSLLDAITKTGFGEITDVDVTNQEPSLELLLTSKQIALLEHIRDGCQHIDKITVHDAEPTQIDIKLELGDYKCTKKLRM